MSVSQGKSDRVNINHIYLKEERIMVVKINNTNYEMTVEMAKALESMLAPYKVDSVDTPTVSKESTKSKTESKEFYTISGKVLTFNSKVFIPRPVFKGIVATIKDCGGKYQSKTKTWLFDNDTEVKEFLNRQSKYTK